MEGFVLLGVQGFEKCRGRVAAEVRADFVDFIQENQRILGLGLVNSFDETTGHSSDIGATMAADFRFVMDAAQGNAGKFASHGAGNGLGERGLADAWGAYETDDGRFRIGRKDADSEVFQNAFFDLGEAVVVFVQDFFRVGQVQEVVAFFGPRQVKDPVQVVSGHGSLGHHRRHGSQMVDFFLDFFFVFFGDAALCQLFSVHVGFFFLVFGVAQFFLDGLELLAQVVVLLLFVHFLADFFFDFRFQAAYSDFFMNQLQHDAQALHDVQLG